MLSSRILAVLAGCSLSASPVVAQEMAQRVELHGFGSWAYGNTSANRFLAGTPDGDYRHANFALNVSAALHPRLTITAQAFWEEGDEGSEAVIDYAFAEWQFSPALRFRVGKIKHPFGVYTEVFDVGTIRPFLNLPQAVYGPAGLVSEAYKGVGLRGSVSAGPHWGVSYDLYAGGIELPDETAGQEFLRGGASTTPAEAVVLRDVIGGRLVIRTPLQPLRVGASAFSGRHVEEGTAHRQTIVGVQAEYLSDRTWLRAEYVHAQEAEKRANAGYVEAAWFLTPHWQLAGAYDRHQTRLIGIDVSAAPSLLAHKEWSAGINYWFTPEFVLKGSFHRVNGNRFASPEPNELANTIAAGELEQITHLLQLGGQFSF